MLKNLAFYLISSILVFSCAMTDIMEIAESGEGVKAPLWDINFSLPLVETTVDFNRTNIMPSDVRNSYTTVLEGDRWPLIKETALDCSASLPFATYLDIDDNGVDDFIIEKIRAGEAELMIDVMVNVGGMPVSISSDQIDLTTIVVEGVTYFLEPLGAGGTVLNYRAINFPAKESGSLFDLLGSGSGTTVDIDRLNLSCLPQGDGQYSGVVSIVVDLSIIFGDRLSVIGNIIRSADLLDLTETVPLNQFPSEGIDEFGIWVEYDSNFSFDIKMESLLTTLEGTSRYYLQDVEGNRVILFPTDQSGKVFLSCGEFSKQDYDLSMQLKLEPQQGVEIANWERVRLALEVRGKTKLGFNL